MSPEKASDPQKGNSAEDEPLDTGTADAQEKTRAAQAPQSKRPRIRRKAARTAAAQTAPDEAAREEPAAEAPAEKAAAERPAAKKAAAEAPSGEPASKAAAKKTPAQGAPRAQPKAAKGAPQASAKPAARAGRRGGKPTRRRVVRARARYVRTSARKARMVCVHLRGKTVPQARAILEFTPREVARDWSKLLESAVANAESNHELLEDDLIVREAYADEGPTIKRFRPRAMGRATPIQKRTSHLTITLIPGP
jgi:ribosomal protein L22